MIIHVARDRQVIGQFDEAEFQEKVFANEILPEDYYWQEGFADWKPVADYRTAPSVVSAAKPPPLPDTQVTRPQNPIRSKQLTPCKKCGQWTSISGARCPSCGAVTRRWSAGAIIAVVVVMLVIIAIGVGRTDFSSAPSASTSIPSPSTVELKDEILNALKMTDRLDALYQHGCSSPEFIAAATPIESVFMNLQKKLPRGDPRRDLLVNTFEAYQQTAIALAANERGRAGRPDASIGAAGVRKVLLTKVLEGNMTPSEKEFYQAWLQGHP